MVPGPEESIFLRRGNLKSGKRHRPSLGRARSVRRWPLKSRSRLIGLIGSTRSACPTWRAVVVDVNIVRRWRISRSLSLGCSFVPLFRRYFDAHARPWALLYYSLWRRFWFVGSSLEVEISASWSSRLCNSRGSKRQKKNIFKIRTRERETLIETNQCNDSSNNNNNFLV